MQRTGIQCFMETNELLMVNMFITETAQCGSVSLCVCVVETGTACGLRRRLAKLKVNSLQNQLIFFGCLGHSALLDSPTHNRVGEARK